MARSLPARRANRHGTVRRHVPSSAAALRRLPRARLGYWFRERLAGGGGGDLHLVTGSSFIRKAIEMVNPAHAFGGRFLFPEFQVLPSFGSRVQGQYLMAGAGKHPAP